MVLVKFQKTSFFCFDQYHFFLYFIFENFIKIKVRNLIPYIKILFVNNLHVNLKVKIHSKLSF